MTSPRTYDRLYDWSYAPAPILGTGPGGSPLVVWDGLWLNTGDTDSGLCMVVTNVEGWLDGPPVAGNDVARVISDGAAWGPKVLGARHVVITGAAAGPRPELARIRAELARRSVAREPAELAIGGMDGGAQVAEVRAGEDAYRHTPLGSGGFRWKISLTAADPIVYDMAWQTAALTNQNPDLETGRPYPREYPWRYGQPYVPNSGLLRNTGNAAAPVYALYEGDLSESTLTGPGGGIIRVAGLDAGVQVLVATATLTAEAPGGSSRASFILPGSRPMALPAGSSARWFLHATGRGSVTLGWRSAWV